MMSVDTKKTQDASCQCPACAGLGGLERPRYFSGQLLTEAELNSEQAYVLAKSRLHNRYLHGAGVVCGLQVVCSKNVGQVCIQPGYALDPYGNDILVDKIHEFNVIERIQNCETQRKQRRRSDYQSLKSSPDPYGKDIERHYCLTLAYQEVQSRPINALRKGCGNGNQSQLRCEPTRITESYSFDVVEGPPNYCGNVQDVWEPTLLAQVVAYVKGVKAFLDSRLRSTKTYETLIPLIFTGKVDASPRDLYDSCRRLHQTIQDLYKRNPLQTHCTASDLFNLVICPSPPNGEQSESYTQQIYTTLYQLLALLVQYVLNDICQLLMSPCPSEMEDRLILAHLTVKNNIIVDICNFCHRRTAGSFPTLSRWLSLVPVVPLLAYALEHICCYNWLQSTHIPESRPAGSLVNGLTSLLDCIDPSGSLRQAIFARNFAWPRSSIDRLEQIIQSLAPCKISALLHPEAFNLTTIVNTPVDQATAAMSKAGVTPIIRKVASVNEVPVLSNLVVSPFARPGEQVVVYRVGDKVVAYAAYTPATAHPQVSELQAEVDTLKRELDALRKEFEQQR